MKTFTSCVRSLRPPVGPTLGPCYKRIELQKLAVFKKGGKNDLAPKASNKTKGSKRILTEPADLWEKQTATFFELQKKDRPHNVPPSNAEGVLILLLDPEGHLLESWKMTGFV